MYEPNENGLGFSLKPPDWLRKLTGAVVRGTTATVPTPAGPVIVDLGDPDSIARAKAAIAGIKINTKVGTKPAPGVDTFNAAVQENIPGGWLTIAALVAGGLFLLPRLMRRGR